MSRLKDNFKYITYKQFVDNKEEVFQLKDCFINCGKPIKAIQTIKAIQITDSSEESSQLISDSSDEDFKYFNNNSETESYDSDVNGFHLIIEEFNKKSSKPKTKKMGKTRSKGRPKGHKTPEPKTEPKVGEVVKPEASGQSFGEESLLEDDFYETNMQLFLSQSLPMTQSSALIQQNGRFAYNYVTNNFKNPNLKVEENFDHLLIPLNDLLDEPNCWPLFLKTITEDIFAFKSSSKYSKLLSHKMLSHYDWSNEIKDMTPEELSYYKRLHKRFLDTFMREMVLSCYSRQAIMELISGSNEETNGWPFVSKLIAFLINELIRKSDDFETPFLHFKYIVDLLVKDFRQFLNDSNDYCVDIQQKNEKPLICRLIWSQKSPNYLNSVLKQLVFLVTKVIRLKNDSFLLEIWKLFELSNECLRIGSGNVRPYVLFAFNKPTPITELFQQLTYQSLITNEVIERLLNVSVVFWIKVELCGQLMTHFILDLKDKYLIEKHRRISLKLIAECLTDVKLLSKSVEKLSDSQPPIDPKPSISTKRESSRRRSSIGLVSKDRNVSSKEWSKKNKFGQNALHIASAKGRTLKVIEILEQSVEGFGPDPNEMDNAGYTPLIGAAIHSQVDCIRALIEWQIKSNKRLDFESGPQKQTALHESIENNAIECTKLILESGGIELLNIKREIDGKTPKDLIKSQEMLEMVETVMSHNVSNVFRPKINVKSAEDSKMFIQILINLFMNYLYTTEVNNFMGGQESWADIFRTLFKREISESDITSIIEDLSVLRKMPKLIESLKTLFVDSAQDLELLQIGINLLIDV